MPFDNMFDDRKAQPGAAGRPTPPCIGAVETLGQTGQVFRGNSLTMIGDAQGKPSPIACLELHRNAFFRSTIFFGIVDEIADDLGKLTMIACDDSTIGIGVKPDFHFVRSLANHLPA